MGKPPARGLIKPCLSITADSCGPEPRRIKTGFTQFQTKKQCGPVSDGTVFLLQHFCLLKEKASG